MLPRQHDEALDQPLSTAHCGYDRRMRKAALQLCPQALRCTRLLAALVLAACKAETPKGAPPEAAPPPSADASSYALASEALAEGAHDYRGTLGAGTSIAVHLVRSGAVVTGAYVYTAIGRPIQLEGNLDAGALALTESLDDKVTGTFRLRPEGDRLTGDWTDPSGKKTFAVRLGAGEPFGASTAADAGARSADGGAASPSERAEACLARPTCRAAEAARLFVVAADARDPALDCLRFLDGAGTPRDLPRGRACLERRADALECGGSSMSLDTAELALLRVDGIGGKADIDRARDLVEGCFDDVSRQGILEHAAAKERDPKTPAADFCKDIDGTTITNVECEARNGKNSDTERQLQAKTVVEGLDAAGRDLFAKSDQAFDDYVGAVGDYVYEVYIDGTIRGAMAVSAENKLKAARIQDLAPFPRFVAKETSLKQVEAAERRRAAALDRVHAGTAAEKAALLKTEQTWGAFRDAEVALYAHAFGPSQGVERVEAAVRVRLEVRRASDAAIGQ
jgi:hypothetical protein